MESRPRDANGQFLACSDLDPYPTGAKLERGYRRKLKAIAAQKGITLTEMIRGILQAYAEGCQVKEE